jgi:succinyl-diaminopimelate desuccinylase
LDLSEPVEAIIEESIDYYAQLLGWEPVKALFWQPSINIGTISGGTAINAVPDSATVRLDFRLAPAVHTTDPIGEIRDCTESCDGVTVSGVS